MSIAKAKEYLKGFNADNRVIETELSSATVELAARALGCEQERIAKTLSFTVGDTPILIVTAGDGRIDNKKYKAEFGCKAQMLKAETVEELIGHAVGGVCPFGINEGVRVYLDSSLKRFKTVFPAVGSANSAIELTLEELEEFSAAEKWIDVCKDL